MYCNRLILCTFLLICIFISGCGSDKQQSKRLVLAKIDSDGDNNTDKTVRYIYDNSNIEGFAEDVVISIQSGTFYGCPKDQSLLLYLDYEVQADDCKDDEESNLNSDDFTNLGNSYGDTGTLLPYQYIHTSNEKYIIEHEDLTLDSFSSDDRLMMLRVAALSETDVPQNVEFIYRHDNDGNVLEFEHIKQYEDNTSQILKVQFTWE